MLSLLKPLFAGLAKTLPVTQLATRVSTSAGLMATGGCSYGIYFGLFKWLMARRSWSGPALQPMRADAVQSSLWARPSASARRTSRLQDPDAANARRECRFRRGTPVELTGQRSPQRHAARRNPATIDPSGRAKRAPLSSHPARVAPELGEPPSATRYPVT